ncbi:MAG: nicotinate phosphoribosyltransferase [Candidatus Acidiferrales bacterium]
MAERSGLLTDLYELAMAAGYIQTGFEATATFELFVRNLPPHRNYLVAAGLEQALEFLENVSFNAEEIDFLRHHPVFRHIRGEFFDYLAEFHFTGEVWAVPEGTLVFPGEPIVRVTSPIAEGQIIETNLLATLGFETLVASKAARVVTAAKGRPVVEFGARRAHGSQAGMLAARAAIIGGCAGTSNTSAGQHFGLHTYGTQAHSWIMAHDDEARAFRHFLDVFPEHAYLLLDTYDVRAALKKILAMHHKPTGVRLDSGDVAADSKWIRRQLDRAGWKSVKIFASGDMDEYRITALLKRTARVDAFGVGTALAVSQDSPNINMIYKLVQVERGGEVREAAKFSKAKITYPGRKQVFRFARKSGPWRGDVIALEDESFPGGRPMLMEVMRGGKRVVPPVSVSDARARCLAGLKRLPERFHNVARSATYPVRYSDRLKELLEKVRARVNGSATPRRSGRVKWKER